MSSVDLKHIGLDGLGVDITIGAVAVPLWLAYSEHVIIFGLVVAVLLVRLWAAWRSGKKGD